jgi:hypothetical protein
MLVSFGLKENIKDVALGIHHANKIKTAPIWG